jgi:hypothetical protein
MSWFGGRDCRDGHRKNKFFLVLKTNWLAGFTGLFRCRRCIYFYAGIAMMESLNKIPPHCSNSQTNKLQNLNVLLKQFKFGFRTTVF